MQAGSDARHRTVAVVSVARAAHRTTAQALCGALAVHTRVEANAPFGGGTAALSQ